MRLFDLSGKTAVITGGGRGIGKSIALALAEAGADIVVSSRTETELKLVCEEIEKRFARKTYYQMVDVTDKKSIDSFVTNIIDEFGKIDILVNGAGMNVRDKMVELEESDWDLVMEVNLKSVYLVSKAVIPYMKKRKSGNIINISSLTSEIAFSNMPVYAASKGGVSQLTKAMAVEYADDGIRTNAIGPGYFKTKMTKVLFEDEEKVNWMKSRIPLKRIGELADLQGSAIFLASKASDYITGQTIYVDGGWLIN